jgi:NAD(P)-dependent dehydrogenase (short-subunit alcohol dehydrogenase family)
MAARPVLLLTGAAEGLGVSMARTFAAFGHDVVGLSRTGRASWAMAEAVRAHGGAYSHLECDITQPNEVVAALRPYSERVETLVHNAHALLIKPYAEITPREFEEAWRVACFGAFLACQAVLPHMAARGSGAIIFTGATAGLRGAAKFAAFASAKFALHGLAQALAREYGPQGIHIAHVVIDGLIDEAQTGRRFGPALLLRMDPDAIARTYVDLVSQDRSAWTHELDLRPFSERY